jgi:hypothetical protein
MRKILLVLAFVLLIGVSLVGAQDGECRIEMRSQQVNRVEVLVSAPAGEWVSVSWPGGGSDAQNGALLVVNLSYDAGPHQTITGTAASGASCGSISVTVKEWLQDGGGDPGQGGSPAASIEQPAIFTFYGELPLHDDVVAALGGLGDNLARLEVYGLEGAFVVSKGAYVEIANIGSNFSPGTEASLVAIYKDGSISKVPFWVNNPDGQSPSVKVSWMCRTDDVDPYC